jgi:DNA polymerase I-like protein with 3'-5' exonuclease and polymerase domains
MMERPFVYIDTEYSNSFKRDMDVICVSMSYLSPEHKGTRTFWVNGVQSGRANLEELAALTKAIQYWQKKDAVFVAYLASAECRALESLGFDTRKLNWICLYAEWRQLNHNNHKRMYGRYLRKGVAAVGGQLVYDSHGYSTPPSLVPSDNEGKDNTPIGNSYAAVAYHLLGEKVDTKHKEKMRDICIRGDYDEIEANRKDISDYCESDIKHLSAMANKMAKEICENFRITTEQYMDIALRRGKFAGSTTARIEREGIPVNTEAIEHLISHVDLARDALVEEYHKSVDHPFIIRQKKTLKDFKAPWVDKYDLFAKYIEANYKDWNLTDSGMYSKDDDDLSEYDADPNIFYYRQVKKALKGLEAFDSLSPSARAKGLITDSIDSADDRLRVLFGIFGTMTGRNAPKARRFVFAMGRWARSLIFPPEGYVVIARDWSSQEFMIAAALSGDQNMMEAYASGDPYMWFAIAAGGAPAGATKKTHGAERTLFKSTTLGLQYGMGVVTLARKLTIDCGREITEKEARKLINLHRKVYKTYWKWADDVVRTYKRDNYIMLADGWGLNKNCQRETTVRNFPVQGTGAVILRRACNLAIEQGLPVVSPLHDAIYICSKEGMADADSLALSDCMNQAVHEVLGDHIHIRQDEERHDRSHPWIEEGAEKIFKSLEPFMKPYADPYADKIERLKSLLDG